jgi:hypothetical protein
MSTGERQAPLFGGRAAHGPTPRRNSNGGLVAFRTPRTVFSALALYAAGCFYLSVFSHLPCASPEATEGLLLGPGRARKIGPWVRDHHLITAPSPGGREGSCAARYFSRSDISHEAELHSVALILAAVRESPSAPFFGPILAF